MNNDTDRDIDIEFILAKAVRLLKEHPGSGLEWIRESPLKSRAYYLGAVAALSEIVPEANLLRDIDRLGKAHVSKVDWFEETLVAKAYRGLIGVLDVNPEESQFVDAIRALSDSLAKLDGRWWGLMKDARDEVDFFVTHHKSLAILNDERKALERVLEESSKRGDVLDETSEAVVTMHSIDQQIGECKNRYYKLYDILHHVAWLDVSEDFFDKHL